MLLPARVARLDPVAIEIVLLELTLLDRTALTLLLVVFVKLTVELAVDVAVLLLPRVVPPSVQVEVALLVQTAFHCCSLLSRSSS